MCDECTKRDMKKFLDRVEPMMRSSGENPDRFLLTALMFEFFELRRMVLNMANALVSTAVIEQENAEKH